MPAVTRLLLAVALCAASLAPTAASANVNDLQVWRLGNPNADFDGANGRFRLLMVDLGMAMTPTPMHPAETTGRAGASMEVGVRLIQVHDTATVGAGACEASRDACSVWVNEGTAEGRPNQDPIDAMFVIPTLQIRKGLPFSFEFETKIQYLVDSEMFATGAGLRWTLNEGFDFLPDVSVGGQGTRVIGNRDFGLTTAALDVTLGKWFGIAGMVQIAPYAGWQRVWVSGISEVIDFDPANETPDNPTADDTIFEDVLIGDNFHDRFFLGFRFNSYIVQVSAEAVYQPGLSVPDTGDANPGYADQSGTFGFSAKLGLDF